MSLFSFKKDERLSSRKSIEKLFKEGASFFIHPFKVYWLVTPLESSFPAQVLISVGKRSFKRAVDRNKTKRLIREAYRQNKTGLYEYLDASGRQCLLALIYIPKTEMDLEQLEKKIKFVFRRLIQELDTNTEQ